MFRRVIAPALIAVGVWFGAMLIQMFWGALDKYAMESVIMSGEGGWMPPVIPTLHWLVFVGVFLAVHLCAGRGGAKRECIVVGLAPLVAGGFVGLAMLAWMAGPAFLPLGAGFGHGVVSGYVSLGTAVAARQLLQQLLGLGFTCLAATWLYFFAARGMQQRPFWLAAEE